MKAAQTFGIVAVLGSATVPANALTFAFNYSAAKAATPLAAFGIITTADSVNAIGGYDITGISGNVDGNVISALTQNPTGSSALISQDGLFTYDNVVFAPTPSLSNAGVLFTSADGDEYNLFSDDATTYELYKASNGAYSAHSAGTLILADVPEPTTWALMLTGFAVVGFAARRRRAALAA